jgi:Mg-chelatase subunit ChlD
VTRLQVLQQAATAGLALFTDTSSLGQWTYGAGHSELSPIGQLTKDYRSTLDQRIASIRLNINDTCALYETLRDAYQTMIDGYDPAVANRIIVFTDGRNTSTGTIKNLEQLNRAIERIAVVTKPIEVTLIGVGPDVDMKELQAIAQMTGGVPAQILDPKQIQSVFLAALLN